MKPTVISLEERLEKLKKGYASDPKYVSCLTKKMGNMRISDYLLGFSEELVNLCPKLGMTKKEIMELTYKDFCAHIHRMLNREKDIKVVRQMVYLLIIPVLVSYEEIG